MMWALHDQRVTLDSVSAARKATALKEMIGLLLLFELLQDYKFVLAANICRSGGKDKGR